VEAVVLGGTLTACGGGDHASSSPTTASRADFCRTFGHLDTGTPSRRAADRLAHVGTPSDIDSGARRGFEVLVDHLRRLPDDRDREAVTNLVRHLHTQDWKDVRAFIEYYGRECS
jgi:hypothetical protein